MGAKSTVYDKIKQYVDTSEGYVVLTRELLRFGSKSEVSRVLKKMNDEWYLRRISIGVYAKAGRVRAPAMKQEPAGASCLTA